MLELVQAIPFAFGALFPVINPIGSAVIFLSLVNGATPQQLKQLAARITLYVIIMLIIVALIGSWLLRIFGISIPIVLLGGGMVLAYLGWQLLNQPDTKNDKDINPQDQLSSFASMAFYPLTLPVTAGPGCIAVAITLGAHGIRSTYEKTLLSQTGNIIGIILIGLTVWASYRYAYTITHHLGAAGTRVIMRLAAFINLCIGLQLMWHGIQILFNLH